MISIHFANSSRAEGFANYPRHDCEALGGVDVCCCGCGASRCTGIGFTVPKVICSSVFMFISIHVCAVCARPHPFIHAQFLKSSVCIDIIHHQMHTRHNALTAAPCIICQIKTIFRCTASNPTGDFLLKLLLSLHELYVGICVMPSFH